VTSSYRVAFRYPVSELIGDLETTERGDPRQEATVPHREWYSAEARRRYGAWGPRPRAYPPLSDLDGRPLEWKRERVVATALRFVGYGYQHHHIPDWSPPPEWPWKHTCAGHNGKGVDCSNLTGFVYNQAFGIRMNTDVHKQAELVHALEGKHHEVRVRRVDLPDAYADRVKALRTGDLVYVRGREDGPVTHVVIWVGAVGRSTSGVPLVIDSHGDSVHDDDGRPIPCGVQLRPFREKSWYNRCASHAHRVFHESGS
jgi:cell wall-associated NlpC family hydrolase